MGLVTGILVNQVSNVFLKGENAIKKELNTAKADLNATQKNRERFVEETGRYMDGTGDSGTESYAHKGKGLDWTLWAVKLNATGKGPGARVLLAIMMAKELNALESNGTCTCRSNWNIVYVEGTRCHMIGCHAGRYEDGRYVYAEKQLNAINMGKEPQRYRHGPETLP
ncbi:hypothetical protein PG987_001469 [Apiospora arundinis]